MFTLGLDIGYSNLKLVFGESKTQPTELCLPAGASPIENLAKGITGNIDKQSAIVEVNGCKWAAGINQERFEGWVRELHKNYTQSDAYQALFYAALLHSEQTKIDRLVTGLPVNLFSDKSIVKALQSKLTGSHSVTPKRNIEVCTVNIIPQPAGSYLDLINTQHYLDIAEHGKILVIDPGFYSVDWVLIDRGEIKSNASGTSLQAMSMMIETLDALIAEEYGTFVSTEKLENLLRANKDNMLIYGEMVNLSALINQAQQKIAPIALKSLQQSLREHHDNIDLVLVTGGGALHYESEIHALFPRSKLHIPQLPVLANARGFWSFGGE